MGSSCSLQLLDVTGGLELLPPEKNQTFWLGKLRDSEVVAEDIPRVLAFWSSSLSP